MPQFDATKVRPDLARLEHRTIFFAHTHTHTRARYDPNIPSTMPKKELTLADPDPVEKTRMQRAVRKVSKRAKSAEKSVRRKATSLKHWYRYKVLKRPLTVKLGPPTPR